MKDYQKNTSFKKFIYSRPVIILLFLLVIIFAYGIVGFWSKMQITKENRILAENRNHELTEEKNKLMLEIEKLKTDDGIEESIRSKFGLAKSGEGMIIVVDDKNIDTTEEKESTGVWSFLKGLFH